MKSNNINQLYENLKRKGITVSRGDISYLKKYSYYQIINAYKPIFIKTVKSIDDIYNDVTSNKNKEIYTKIFNLESKQSLDPNLFYLEICKSVLKKYSLDTKGLQINDAKKLIKEKNYVLHIYQNSTKLKDFVRMYQFEHALRNLLLKYVLRIEEDIKTIFINTLNDLRLDYNYLLNINNYDVKNDKAIESIIKVFKKQNNSYSKPINRKKSQNMIPPYWILVNELTLGELMHTIKSMESETRNQIIDNLINHFTIAREKNPAIRNAILSLLGDLSKFRNDLAHNNPIYLYNIHGNSLSLHPIIQYNRPAVNNIGNKDKSKISAELSKKKSQILSDLSRFFGEDSYNKRVPSDFNIDLSYIIYILYKFTKIIDPDTHYAENIKKIYTEFGIFKLVNYGQTFNHDIYQDNINLLKTTYKLLNDIQNITYKSVENKKDFKLLIKSFKESVVESKNNISNIIKNSNVLPMKIRFDDFSFTDKYSKYTGISQDFISSILL